jgi:alkanesulfonate monooxygenase SsuD/methylene tetrahydromethanopterin reductase-like flavin-dependent oxidoreductase (luciferase family)
MSQVQQDQRREQLAKNYQLLRRLWRAEKITWEGRFRPPLTRVTSQPTSTAKDAAAITEGTGQTIAHAHSAWAARVETIHAPLLGCSVRADRGVATTHLPGGPAS